MWQRVPPELGCHVFRRLDALRSRNTNLPDEVDTPLRIENFTDLTDAQQKRNNPKLCKCLRACETNFSDIRFVIPNDHDGLLLRARISYRWNKTRQQKG